MFNKDFYPTPEPVILRMLEGYDVRGKVVLEPSAGKGNIVDVLLSQGAEVIACEKNEDLKKIVASKCRVIQNDFLKLKSEDISHIDFIVMNPPFSAADKHLVHAWHIAPAGCTIIALCNKETITNRLYSTRQHLGSLIEEYGHYQEMGNCFNQSERHTDVKIALVHMVKPATDDKNEFAGFFMDEDPEEEQMNGLMPYNFVRDLVNRYVAAVKLYDQQLELGVQMNHLTSGFYSSSFGFSITQEEKPKSRADFKKDLQKSGWNFIFEKMNMEKYATRGLKQDINKFVEKQAHIPFTMKNIYMMLQIVIGTNGQRMDKALLEVFDNLTHHYHDNRYNVEGWKTNSHYLINQKFIMPFMCQVDKWHTGNTISTSYGRHFDLVEDLLKAICYITGDNYDNHCSLSNFVRYQYKMYSNKKFIGCTYNLEEVQRTKKEYYEEGKPFEYEDSLPVYGRWFTWGHFEIRAYKKGTMHFKFRSESTWALFNQNIARLKGYPLYEGIKKTPKEKEKQTNADARSYARTGRFQKSAA